MCGSGGVRDRLGMRLPLCLLALVPLLLGIAAVPAAATPVYSSTTKLFDVQITGSHVVEWAYASALQRPDCSSWSVGKGTFEVTYQTAKKARYQLTEVRRDGRLTELQWGATRYRSLDVGITQNGDWQDNNGFKMACTPCGPSSEYGPCVPDPAVPPKPSCPRREAKGVFDTTIYREVRRESRLDDVAPPRLHGAGLLVEVRFSEDDKAGRNCYPWAGGQGQPLPQPAALVLGVNRLRDMKRGAVASLDVGRTEYLESGALQDGDRCRAIDGVLKMNACGKTRIALDVKRVR